MFFLFLAAAIFPKPDELQCVRAGNRIEINIPSGLDKRIGSLAVVYRQKWLTLVDEDHHLAAFRPGVRRVILERSLQMGVYWGDDGKERWVKVFGKPGTYRIVLADNLETEPENMDSVECLVRVR